MPPEDRCREWGDTFLNQGTLRIDGNYQKLEESSKHYYLKSLEIGLHVWYPDIGLLTLKIVRK